MDITSVLDLNDGYTMPQFGLGVYRSTEGDLCKNAMKWAFDAGYRHIDTASFYANERSVGEAVRDSKIPRQDVFITSKLWNDDQGYDNTLKAFEESMLKLNLEYLDLYLVHFPVQDLRKDTWKAMEVISKDERCRSIGVSNYMKHHLEELYGFCKVPPAVNQIELHPFNYQTRIDTVDFSKKNNIQITTYCPLTRGQKFDHPVIQSLAAKYEQTPAQMLLRWALQHGFSTIPKSSNQQRILENADIFDFKIEEADMTLLDEQDEDLCVTWNPMETD